MPIHPFSLSSDKLKPVFMKLALAIASPYFLIVGCNTMANRGNTHPITYGAEPQDSRPSSGGIAGYRAVQRLPGSKATFEFRDAEIGEVVTAYADWAQKSAVVDPAVKGQVTIWASTPISHQEAFALLSSALATNGYAFVQEGESLVVRPARLAVRGLMEVTTTLPTLKPERLATYVYEFKNADAAQALKDARNMVSKDGELTLILNRNKVVITDWTSSLHRVDKLLIELDRPLSTPAKRQ